MLLTFGFRIAAFGGLFGLFGLQVSPEEGVDFRLEIGSEICKVLVFKAILFDRNRRRIEMRLRRTTEQADAEGVQVM